MKERYKIFVEQLRDGRVEKLEEVFTPEFLDVHEKELCFADPVKVCGEAYLADDDLVLHLDADTFCSVPCRICNEPVKLALGFKGFYHAIPLSEIKTGVYEYNEILRETLLLEVPALAECHGGKCPQRREMAKYLKKENPLGKADLEDGYQPFADLDIALKPKKVKKN